MKTSIKPFARAYKSRSFKLHGAPSMTLDEEDKNISFNFSISEPRSAHGLTTSDRRVQELHQEAESIFRRAFSTSETPNPESDTALNAHASGRVLPCLLEESTSSRKMTKEELRIEIEDMLKAAGLELVDLFPKRIRKEKAENKTII